MEGTTLCWRTGVRPPRSLSRLLPETYLREGTLHPTLQTENVVKVLSRPAGRHQGATAEARALHNFTRVIV